MTFLLVRLICGRVGHEARAEFVVNADFPAVDRIDCPICADDLWFHVLLIHGLPRIALIFRTPQTKFTDRGERSLLVADGDQPCLGTANASVYAEVVALLPMV
jgi:hypothetical protein